MVPSVIQEWKDTYKFAKLDESPRIIPTQEPSIENESPVVDRLASPLKQSTVQIGKPVELSSIWNKSFTWPLSGETTAVLTISGDPPKKQELDLLSAYLELAKKALSRSSEENIKDEML
jgi:hypothetical protein